MVEPRTVEVYSDFGPIVAFRDDLITRQIRRFGNHTRPEFAFATSVLDPRMAVFDIGAHIGTFALTALRKVCPDRVLAVEGNAAAHALLRKNLGAGVCTLNAFVGAEPGMAYEAKPGNSGAGHLVPGNSLMDVRSASLDSLVEQYFEPEFIKIDVEGMEYACLEGSQFLRSERPILYLEVFAPHMATHGATPADLQRLLEPLGYRFFRNAGDRNGAHDVFHVAPVQDLSGLSGICDVLCVPKTAPVLAPLMTACGAGLVRRARRFGFGQAA